MVKTRSEKRRVEESEMEEELLSYSEEGTEVAFLRHYPAELHGSAGPAEIWEWLMQVESIFVEMRTGDQDRIRWATKKFRGPALDWWRSFKQQVGARNAHKMTWTQFRKVVIVRFQLEDHVASLEREFLALQKKWMSVEEYIKEFRERMHLVRHIVHGEADMIRYFAQGLPKKYRRLVKKASFFDYAVYQAKAVEGGFVDPSDKQDEAARSRAKRMRVGEVGGDECPRCGGMYVPYVYCACLVTDCSICRDWRHTDARCPRDVEKFY